MKIQIRIVTTTMLSIIFLTGYTQSLTKPRIDKLKACIGRVTVEDANSTGTGFFVDSDGSILTCWHVISPAITKDSLNRIIGMRRIFVETNDGSKVEYGIPTIYFSNEKLNFNAVAFDFCTLSPLQPLIKHVQYLRIGNFDDVQEGDEIYTAGYPLGLSYQFISRGTLSTKYVDSTMRYKRGNSPEKIIQRSVALLDLTLNKGNSGGPIIRLGASIEEDEVIGIANFLINPFGQNAEKLSEQLNKDNINYRLPSGISLTESLKLFSAAVIYSANGISGCVSIDHFLQAIR